MHLSVRGGIAVAAIVLIALSPGVAYAAPPAGDHVSASELLAELRTELPSAVSYSRDAFFEGQDLDGNGCRTRQEVLVAESQVPVTTTGTCTVTAGQWYSYYDDVTYLDPTQIEMDHLVAMKEAWVSGAYAWTDSQRTAYSNDTDDPRTLVLVTGSVNNAKSDKDPSRWLPPFTDARCTYATEWVAVKWRWNLAVDANERASIESVLATCSVESTVTRVPFDPAGGKPATPTPTPTPTAESVEPTAVYRFWSPVYQGHFFTTDTAERDEILRKWPGTWTYEGQRYTAFSTPTPGTIPLYRFWSDQLGGHFYTADGAEKDTVLSRWPDTWSYEGIAYYVYPRDSTVADTVSVARFWSPTARHHFYTASATERDRVIQRWSSTWAYEGDNFRVPAAGVPDEPPAPVDPPPPPVTDPPPPGPTQPSHPGDTKNCSDFRTYAEAKSWYDIYFPSYGDVAKLDQDNDGIPCESLPGAPR